MLELPESRWICIRLKVRCSKPKPEPGEAFTRFLALAVDMGKLASKDIVAGIPAANRRAELMGHVRGLHDLLDAIDGIMEGGSDA